MMSRFTGVCVLVLLAVLGQWIVPPAHAAGQDERGRTLSVTGFSDAEEVYVVSATRLLMPVDEIGSSVSVITSTDLAQTGARSLEDALSTVQGLDVVRSGGQGQTATVMIRGAKSEHTLVLIDGVEANDPSSPTRGALVGALTTDAVDRIEIVRGPQGTLYGSDAIGGVINIITKKGSGAPSARLEVEGGSLATTAQRAFMSGQTGRAHYAASISLAVSEGISASSEKYGNTEKDGYETVTFASRLGWAPSDKVETELVARYIDQTSDLDINGGPFGDDPNYTQSTRQLFLRPQVRLDTWGGIWKQRLGVSFSHIDRDYANDTDTDHPNDSERGAYTGRIVKLDWQHDISVHDANTLTLGLESQKESMSSEYASQSAWGPYTSIFDEKSARTGSLYAQDAVRLMHEAWVTTLGVRVDDHSRFGSKATFRIASSLLVQQTATRFRASYGTGFKAPSLYQLYSDYGNRELDPEKSTGYDAGIEQAIPGAPASLELTYFHNLFEDLIDFDSAAQRYKNVGEARSDGWEAALSATPWPALSLRASFTLTRTEDRETGNDLLRRPKHKAGLDANWKVSDTFGIRLDIRHTGARDDEYYDTSTWSSRRVRLDPYTLVNIAWWYEPDRKTRFWVRIDNLLDEDYEEIWGYQTPGIGVSAGVGVTL